MPDVYTQDIGTRITRTVYEDVAGTPTVVDVSGAAAVYLYLTDPAGTTTQLAAGFKTDGTDGRVTYKRTTAWVTPGRWTGYFRISWDADDDYNTTPFCFTVHRTTRP